MLEKKNEKSKFCRPSTRKTSISNIERKENKTKQTKKPPKTIKLVGKLVLEIKRNLITITCPQFLVTFQREWRGPKLFQDEA